MNDEERRLWVLNDERLYLDWRASRQGLRRYIREHRAELDGHIAGRLHPERKEGVGP
jgi:hypothetical protein